MGNVLLTDADLLAACVRAVKERVDGRGGIDGKLPASLGDVREEARRIQRLFEAGRIVPKRLVGPADCPCPTTYERIIGRYILQKFLVPVLAELLEPGASPLPGSSCAMEQEEVLWWTSEAPDLLAVVTDASGCFENIDRRKVRPKLMQLGVPEWVMKWIAMSLRKSGFTKGIPRGYPWAPAIVAMLVAHVDRVVLDQPGVLHQRRLGDDSIAIVRTKEEADHVFAIIKAESKKLGLSLNEGKTYVGPLSGAFKFLGLDYENGTAHPPDKAIWPCPLVRVKGKKVKPSLWERLLHAKDDDHRFAIVRGWIGTYSVAAKSAKLLGALDQISARYPELGDLRVVLNMTATRSRQRRLQRRFPDPAHAASRLPVGTNVARTSRGASGADEERPKANHSPKEGTPPGHSTPSAPRLITRVEGNPVTLVAVQLDVVRALDVEAEGEVGPLASRRGYLDPLDLEARPERIPILPRFEFRLRAIEMDASEVVSMAEAITAMKKTRSHRQAGLRTFAGFCRLLLREDERFVRHVEQVGLAIRDAAIGANATLSGFLTAAEEDEADERVALVPPAVVRKFIRIKSRRHWATHQAHVIFAELMDGRCSIRAARASVHWSVGRAILQARRPAHKRTGVSWSLRRRDGWLTREGDLQPC